MKRTLCEGKFIRLMADGPWEYAERVNDAGVVCVVAIDQAHVILVEEYRPPVAAPVISLPAGLVDRARPGETQESDAEAALRELREETGYTARRIEEVARGPISAGMTNEKVTFFLAQDLEAGEASPDTGENITMHRVPLTQVRAWLAERRARGAEIDPKIFAGLYFVG
jgi:ADP-ribose pyrophosphatase